MEKPTILIVDDESDIVAAMSLRFAARGLNVLTAEDGGEALTLFNQARPDIVLMDVQMPTLDGVEVLREMLEIDPDAHVIIMSGQVTVPQAKMVLDEGARDFFPKPVHLPALERSVESLLMVSELTNRRPRNGSRASPDS